MDNLFERIKYVGFDLDNTLYPLNEKIEDRIKKRFAEVTLEKIPGLKNVETARKFFEKRYEETGSRTQVLKKLGFLNPETLAEECMTTTEFLDLLKYDAEVVSLLENIKTRYNTFLITGSPKKLSISKLEKLGFSLSLFDYVFFGDNSEGNKKIDGSIYKSLLNKSKYPANQHVYIGDNVKGDIIPAKALGIKTIAIGKEIKEADFSVDKIQSIEKLLL